MSELNVKPPRPRPRSFVIEKKVIVIQRWYRNIIRERHRRQQEKLASMQKYMLDNLTDADPFTHDYVYELPERTLLIYTLKHLRLGCHLVENLKWLNQFEFTDRPIHIFTGCLMTETEYEHVISTARCYIDNLIKRKKYLEKIDNDNKHTIPDYILQHESQINDIQIELNEAKTLLNQLGQTNYYRKNPIKWTQVTEQVIEELKNELNYKLLEHPIIKKYLNSHPYKPLTKSNELTKIYNMTYLECIEEKRKAVDAMEQKLTNIKIKMKLINPLPSAPHASHASSLKML